MNDPLSLLCISIVVFAIAMYVLLDGFDLGVGILLLSTRDGEERDQLVESIAPVWDGNETWLVLAGIVLFSAFPVAYATLTPAFYLPIMLMLVSLGFRGVSVEFRMHTPFKRFWDWAFSIGSTIAAFCQGLLAGALVSGSVVMSQGEFAGRTTDVFTVFNCLMGVTAVAAYAILGGGWINWKTQGALQRYQRAILRGTLLAFFVLVVLACILASISTQAEIVWNTRPALITTAGLVCVALWLAAYFSLRSRSDKRPLVFILAMIGTLLLGVVATIWPYAVPFSLSFSDAAASHGSRVIVAIGAMIMLPVVIGYNAYAYWVFRGKVDTVTGT